MRKKALRKEFYMEIRKTLNRFLSILSIVALGVAFYSGIQSAAPDMRDSGDAYFDENQLMDLRVIGTLGLTDADVAALEAVEGISKAEAGYMADVLCGEETQQALRMESISTAFNRLTPSVGRLPEAAGECFLDIEFLDASDYQVGDDITLYGEDADSFALRRSTFTIVGAGSSPLYISFGRGNTTLGNGELAGVGYLLPEDFDLEAYTQVYLEAEGAKAQTAYTPGYDDLIAQVQARVEEIAGARCEARYAEVVGEANEKLADAKQELEDGRAEGESELAEAAEALEEARAQIFDGKRELADSAAKLKDAKQEWEDGKAAIEENEATLEKSEQDLADARQQLADGQAQLADGKQQLAANEQTFQQQYDAGIAEIEAGEQQLADAKEALNAGKEAYKSGKKQYKDGRASYKEGKAQYKEGLAEYERQAKEWEEKKAGLAAQRAELAGNQGQLQTAIPQMETQLAALQEQRTQTQAALDDAAQKLDALAAARAQIEAANAQKAQLDGQIAACENSLAKQQAIVDAQQQLPEESRDVAALEAAAQAVATYQAQLDQLTAAQGELARQLEEANQQLAPLAEAEPALTEGVQTAQAAISQIDGGIAALQAELETQRGNLAAVEDGIAQIDAGISQGDAAVAAGAQQLAASKAQLDEAKATLDASKKQLGEARAEIDAGEKEIAENEQKLKDGRQELENGRQQLENARAVIAQNEQKLADAQAQITSGETQLADGKQQLADAKKELSDAWEEIADGERQLAEGVEEFHDGERAYKDGLRDYQDGVREFDEKIADGEAKIADAEEEVAKLKMPEWTVDDRSALPDNVGYGENADRMRSLGQVFPALFFLVAALISLTTMTRMVEEERTQIGTLKALGYGKLPIATKYLLYALAATLVGSVVGVAFGEKFLPFVIVTAYRIMYHHMNTMVLPYNTKFALIATGAAVFSTMAATLAACFKELAATPAVLMRPPAPKEGKRVLLERIPFVWKHLSFSWKSTVRNLFRYKKRFFMTIFGISGCMALMLVGYGLRDSIMDVARLQFEDLQIYDGMVILDSDASESAKAELVDRVAAEARVENYTLALMRADTVRNGKKSWDLYVMVPEDVDAFADFVKYRDRETQEPYELTDEGAILTEKIADMMGVKEGGTITVEDEDRGDVQVPVAKITENYLSHYIYLTPALYAQCFGETPDYGTVLYRMRPEEKEQVSAVGEELLDFDAALSVSYTGTLMGQLNDMLSALDAVMIVLIVSAGMLAFVVLYNLNNININERKRELATIKVLGFYDSEVSAYVYRENILLTIIGIAAGAGLGILLHRFTITTVEVDACMFGRNIKPASFLYCAAFTAGFSIFVNVLMHFKLKKIDMVESLKSVE